MPGVPSRCHDPAWSLMECSVNASIVDKVRVQMERKRVGIVLFEDIEVLDFFDHLVFSATRVNE
jgi:hypothetical protein